MQLIKSFVLAPKQEYSRQQLEFIQRFMKILDEEIAIQSQIKQTKTGKALKIPPIINYRSRSLSTNLQSIASQHGTLPCIQSINKPIKQEKIDLLPKLSIREFEFKDVEPSNKRRKLQRSRKIIK